MTCNILNNIISNAHTLHYNKMHALHCIYHLLEIMNSYLNNIYRTDIDLHTYGKN